MKKVNRIEPAMPALPGRKKVAAYARVSRDTERLMNSVSAQISHYSALIQNNPEWEYAGVYADCGISGTGTAKRSEFLRMLDDCGEGKIDIILTKSISRFARNTVDLLETVRHLKDLGIEVRFEKEHINSLSEDGELMLTLLASFAQEESRSISENSKWGIRKRYQTGEIGVKNKRVFGYEYDGETYVAVPEEAEIVRLIFERFTSGVPLGEIKRELDGMGAASCRGYGISYGQMNYILRNEIYVGDRKYQKCFVQDPITKSKIPNRGQLPQYYVKDDHAPIISREVFAAAQAEISRRSGFINPTYPFTRKIKCSACGMFFTRRIYRSDAKWFCRSKKEVGMTCKSHSYLESELYKIFTEVLGTDTFDSEVFEASAKEIISLPDGSLEMKFFDGTTKVWQMPPPPPKKPEPKPERKRPAHPFDGKIFCGQCGRRYGRATSDSKDRHLYWYCRAKSHHGVTCDSVNYPDTEIKEIFCGIMGQESFDEGYFLKTVERMVVQKTGSIDFHLKDGTARHYETLKLRNSIHRTTSTDEFIGKIKCASCGNLYHRYSCYGTYVYWKCLGKSKAGTECCGKDLADFNIRKVSAYIMGLEEFDGAEFGKQVEGITALEDGSLEFNFYGGRTERWQRA